MSAPHIPASPPRARLAVTGIALACCLVVYIVAVPLLLHSGPVGWQVYSAMAIAVLAAAGVLATIWQLRADLTDSRSRLAQQSAQTAQASHDTERQSSELNRQAQEISRQADKLSVQASEISTLTSEVSRHREREAELVSECGRLRETADAAQAKAGTSQAQIDQANKLAEAIQLEMAAMEHAVQHTVSERIPAALMGELVPLAEDDGVNEETCKLLEEVVDCATDAGAQQDSMRSAVVALARRVQSSAHRIQEEATLMADRHPGNADVLEVSMRVDHAAAQQARAAQSMAVLLGEWPGQQWQDPLPLVDVVRGAAGRITAYQRVEVVGDQNIAAAPQVVEPLIHVIAELLANATQSSPPTTQVPVTVRSVQRGAVIEVHDCGVGLDDYRLAQAREIATGERYVGLEGLGEFPQTGLAVVGQYVRRHGFRVDISESVYGGVRAIVGVPAALTETVEPADALPSQTAAALSETAEPAKPAKPAGPAKSATTATSADAIGMLAEASDDTMPLTRRQGLPRRVSPRHAPDTAVYPGDPGVTRDDGYATGPRPAFTERLDEPTPTEAGAWMGAFLTSPEPADESPAPKNNSAISDHNSTGQQEQ